MVAELTLDVTLGKRELALALETEARTLAVVGPSGSGKTTLLRVLAGLEPRARGRVEHRRRVLQDTPTGRFVPPWERRLGWVPQEATLLPHRDVRTNLAWSGADGTEVDRLAAALRIEHLLARRPRHLSGGERQRVAVGRALLARPGLLLLDEPFSALDPELRGVVISVVRRHLTELDATLVLVSHARSDAEALVEETWCVTSAGRLRCDIDTAT